MRVEEERDARREIIDGQARLERRVYICQPVRKGESYLLHSGRTGLANVIAADRNGVPVGDFAGAERERVGDQPQRWLRREDVGPPGYVFLQDVVLNRAADFFKCDALFSRD